MVDNTESPLLLNLYDKFATCFSSWQNSAVTRTAHTSVKISDLLHAINPVEKQQLGELTWCLCRMEEKKNSQKLDMPPVSGQLSPIETLVGHCISSPCE